MSFPTVLQVLPALVSGGVERGRWRSPRRSSAPAAGRWSPRPAGRWSGGWNGWARAT
ncbi:hypothetical protein ACFQY5_07400 [Paeniroseomonas aquatica]|uniref:hypothetical protein n=1 Tax=Paeniroseomonas aquatica TaxID=373043 RepID=UPI00360A36B0